jgi:hypothetical protein
MKERRLKRGDRKNRPKKKCRIRNPQRMDVRGETSGETGIQNGTRNQGIKQQLHLGSKSTSSKAPVLQIIE